MWLHDWQREAMSETIWGFSACRFWKMPIWIREFLESSSQIVSFKNTEISEKTKMTDAGMNASTQFPFCVENLDDFHTL